MTIIRINNKVSMTTLEKAEASRIHDTKSYRYMVKELPDHAEIVRLSIDSLDTTAALNGWETVAEIN